MFYQRVSNFFEAEGDFQENKVMDTEYAWYILVEAGIATDEELQLVTNINGYTLEQMENVLYARTGYHSFDQLEG